MKSALGAGSNNRWDHKTSSFGRTYAASVSHFGVTAIHRAWAVLTAILVCMVCPAVFLTIPQDARFQRREVTSSTLCDPSHQTAVTPGERLHSPVRGPSHHHHLSRRRPTERWKSVSGFMRRRSRGGSSHYRRQRAGPSPDSVAPQPLSGSTGL